MVPATGIPNRKPAWTLLVRSNPGRQVLLSHFEKPLVTHTRFGHSIKTFSIMKYRKKRGGKILALKKQQNIGLQTDNKSYLAFHFSLFVGPYFFASWQLYCLLKRPRLSHLLCWEKKMWRYTELIRNWTWASDKPHNIYLQCMCIGRRWVLHLVPEPSVGPSPAASS